MSCLQSLCHSRRTFALSDEVMINNAQGTSLRADLRAARLGTMESSPPPEGRDPADLV